MGRMMKKENSVSNDYFAGFALIFIDAIFVFLVFICFQLFGGYRTYDNWQYGFSLGGTFAIAFQIAFYIAGGLKNPVGAVMKRWKDFFDDLKISVKFAFEGLFESFRDDGIVLIWYLLILLATINMSVHGFKYLFALYGI